MGKQKVLMLTFHNAMSMTILIDGQEVTVRDCPESAFTQWLNSRIEAYSDRAAIEKELSGLAYCHMADRWFTLNVMRRRSIKLTEER